MKVLTVLAMVILLAGCGSSPTGTGDAETPIVVSGVVTSGMEVAHGIFSIPTGIKGLYTPVAVFSDGVRTVYPVNIAIAPTGYIIVWVMPVTLVGFEYEITLVR